MKTLIDDILAIEKDAERVLEEARAKASALGQQADARIRELESKGLAALEQRIAETRAAVEQKHNDDAAAEQVAQAQALKRLKELPQDALNGQVSDIVARFREL